MPTMYQTLDALARNEIITSQSTGLGHARARSEIMRVINHYTHTNPPFNEELIIACAESRLTALTGKVAMIFDEKWPDFYKKMAANDGRSVDDLLNSISLLPPDRLRSYNMRVSAAIKLHLPVMESEARQREEAELKRAEAKILSQEHLANAREEIKSARDEILSQTLKGAQELLVANAARENESEGLRLKNKQTMSAIRIAEIEAAKKLAAAEIKPSCDLPDLGAVSGKGWRELEAFVKRVGGIKAQGAPLSKQDQELCKLVAESIVAPFKLPKSTDSPLSYGKPPASHKRS